MGREYVVNQVQLIGNVFQMRAKINCVVNLLIRMTQKLNFRVFLLMINSTCKFINSAPKHKNLDLLVAQKTLS